MTNYDMDAMRKIEKDLEKEEMREDEVAINPSHYDIKIQPLEYIMSNNLGFIEGNIIKYITRYPKKGGVDDLYKARNNLEILINKENTERERA